MVSGIVGFLVGLIASWLSIKIWLTSFHWTVIPVPALFGMICGAFTGRWIATYSRREASRVILDGALHREVSSVGQADSPKPEDA